ncbi:MAG: hypothetical protein ACLTAF_00645 [Blautia coccoides]
MCDRKAGGYLPQDAYRMMEAQRTGKSSALYSDPVYQKCGKAEELMDAEFRTHPLARSYLTWNRPHLL